MKVIEANTYISCDGTLRELAVILSGCIEGADFRVDTDMCPPHSEHALTEALGFELQLDTIENGFFELSLRSCLIGDLSKHDPIDLSDWWSGYVSLMSGLDCKPTYPETALS